MATNDSFMSLIFILFQVLRALIVFLFIGLFTWSEMRHMMEMKWKRNWQKTTMGQSTYRAKACRRHSLHLTFSHSFAVYFFIFIRLLVHLPLKICLILNFVEANSNERQNDRCIERMTHTHTVRMHWNHLFKIEKKKNGKNACVLCTTTNAIINTPIYARTQTRTRIQLESGRHATAHLTYTHSPRETSATLICQLTTQCKRASVQSTNSGWPSRVCVLVFGVIRGWGNFFVCFSFSQHYLNE